MSKDNVVFTEVRTNLMDENGEDERSYSMFVKWKGNTPIDFKILNSKNQSIKREIEKEGDTLFGIDVFKKMVEGISQPENVS